MNRRTLITGAIASVIAVPSMATETEGDKFAAFNRRAEKMKMMQSQLSSTKFSDYKEFIDRQVCERLHFSKHLFLQEPNH